MVQRRGHKRGRATNATLRNHPSYAGDLHNKCFSFPSAMLQLDGHSKPYSINKKKRWEYLQDKLKYRPNTLVVEEAHAHYDNANKTDKVKQFMAQHPEKDIVYVVYREEAPVPRQLKDDYGAKRKQRKKQKKKRNNYVKYELSKEERQERAQRLKLEKKQEKMKHKKEKQKQKCVEKHNSNEKQNLPEDDNNKNDMDSPCKVVIINNASKRNREPEKFDKLCPNRKAKSKTKGERKYEHDTRWLKI